MKKIFTIAFAFLAIALLPQTSFAQTETKPVTDKEQKIIKTSKGDVVPVRTTTKEGGKLTKKVEAPKPKQKPTPTQTKPASKPKKGTKGSTMKPREAIIKPIKNTNEKKVVVGKKIEKKNKNKKLQKVQQNN